MYYWVTEWASASDQKDSLFFDVFGLILAGLFIFGTIRFGSIFFGLTVANRKLHNDALRGVVMQNSVFFDKNPTGRVLNRFTKDTMVIDEPLHFNFSEFFHIFYLVTGSIIVAMIISPISLLSLIVLGVLIIVLFKKVIPVSVALRKLEILSRSPLLTSVNTIVNGIITIRCLGLQKKFLAESKKASNENMRAFTSY